MSLFRKPNIEVISDFPHARKPERGAVYHYPIGGSGWI